MQNFKEWIAVEEYLIAEMAIGDIMRVPVPMDQDDINYLEKFPIEHWKEALKRRYNDYLLDALDERGKVRKGYKDLFGIRKVVRKLTDLGYDLRNTDPQSGHLKGMQLMQLHNAHAILYPVNGKPGWIRWSAKQRGIRLAPPAKRKKTILPRGFHLVPQPAVPSKEYQLWVPNAMKRASYGYPDVKMSPGMMQILKIDAQEGVELELQRNRKHWNYGYLADHADELVNLAVEDLVANQKRDEFNDRNWRIARARYVVRLEFNKEYGGGTIRHASRMKKLGVDPHEIMIKRGRGVPDPNALNLGPTKGPNEPGWQLTNDPMWSIKPRLRQADAKRKIG